jgi:hypothetical protein
MSGCRALFLREFVVALARLEPVSYRTAYRWAFEDVLPTWPRHRHERYRVKLGEPLRRFLLTRGHEPEDVDAFLQGITGD